jgi:hypothetical protein
MRRLPGKVLHPGLDRNRPAIGRALSRAVSQLHAIRFPHVGEYRGDLDDIASPAQLSNGWSAA